MATDVRTLLMGAAKKVDQILGKPTVSSPEEEAMEPMQNAEEEGVEALGIDRLIPAILPKLASLYPDLAKYPQQALVSALTEYFQDRAPIPLSEAMAVLTSDPGTFRKMLDVKLRAQKLSLSMPKVK